MDFSTAAQLNGSRPHYGRWCDSPNGALWNVGPVAVSLRLDAGELDHLAPLFGLFGDELAEVGRRAWKWGGAPLGKPRLHLGIGKGRVDLRVELLDDVSGRVFRHA